ncbi:4-hydroxy-tetrahydrodipicolinate reductase [Diaphorobacter aerolatus]|uniref:4-hydroxy-tetrahydrodipicolinate reductase n=1 Tax=Diaphorobacter aerolatus TaxID=1288495 RepID=A0A7H0GH15_9BURK|nr:4-hydroxy-tetrahydrodipicolinate reductase [Diaphorobacter aerolatus]QNP47581.1 4-hydroxy-tetrahydrodipicolinate reductase [Diaphorobacter aerolatus]
MTAPTSSAPRRVAVAGASGRMGRMLIEAIRQSSDCVLSGALDVASNPGVGTDATAFLGHASGVQITSNLRTALANADVLIDFTRPDGTMNHLAACEDLGVQMVIGTTGLTDEQKARLVEGSKKIGIVFAPNMSVGVNVALKLLELAAKAMNDDGYDIEIIEAHHKHKIDAPSGTALKMGEVIAKAQDTQLADRAIYERYGETGARKPGSIGFATVRGGDIVGDHTVLFCSEGERIEIAHKSSSRAGYVRGSLRAVAYLADKKNGMFDMFDVLGLND